MLRHIVKLPTNIFPVDLQGLGVTGRSNKLAIVALAELCGSLVVDIEVRKSSLAAG